MEERDAIEGLISAIRATQSDLSRAGANNRNTTSVSINAGGLGVWIATTACLVMLACNVFLSLLVMDHSRQIADLDSYLSAIYMQAPYLKPADKDSSK